MKEFLQKIRLYSAGPNWLEYTAIFFVWGVWLFFYAYIDFKSLTIWSTTLTDCLLDGNLYYYYEVVHENIHGAPHEYFAFNYIAVIPWAIWNIPICLIQRFLHVEILQSTWLMLWSHLFLLVVVGIIIYFEGKILDFFLSNRDEKLWCIYLTLSFPFMFLGVILAGQTDIIIICVTVIAVYFLLKDRQGIFIALMAISIAAKPFFIFAYIAVIVLIEKNIIKIVGKAIPGVGLLVLFHLIYQNAPLYMESYNAGTGNSIIENSVSGGIAANITYTAPFMIIGLIVIYFAAYIIHYDSSKEKKYYVVYMMVAPMIMYFCFSSYEYYRMIYLVPFLMILMAINRRCYRLNLLLEVMISVVGMFLMVYYKWTASVEYFNHNVMRVLGMGTAVNECKYNSLYELLAGKIENLPMIQNIGAGIFVCVSMIFLVINIPMVSGKIEVREMKVERYLYWMSPAAIYVFTGALLMCYLNLIG